MELIIRLETPRDYRGVEELTREAFWGFTGPACDEHYLAHRLRTVPAFVPELDFVAESEGRLVGNILYSRARVADDHGADHEVLTFGPLSVLPAYWFRGVGSALMRHSIGRAKELGFSAIVFYGHPDYYPRFGFREASAFGIAPPHGKGTDALMAMELRKGALDGVSGAFHEDPVFRAAPEEVRAFDLGFPHKKPSEMVPLDVLLDRLDPLPRRSFEARDIPYLALLQHFSGRELMGWEGVDEKVLDIVNRTLREYGYAKKLPPSSEIFRQPPDAENG